MQLVINSSNIGTFVVVVSIDVYNRTVKFDTSQTSYVGGGASVVRGISFSLVDQSGIELADGGINFTTPQIVGPISNANWIWTLDLSSVDFAFLFQSYKIIAAIQDSDGTRYQTVPVIKTLCQPQNLTDTGYVPGMFQIIPDCVSSVITVKEITLLVYNNLQPSSVSKTGTLNYPTGTISQVAFANTPFSNNVVYTGQYNIQCTTIGTYNLNDDVYVLITYLTYQNFPVTCQNRISDLMCCILKVQETALRHCDDELGQNAKSQLYDILPYVTTGIAKEISGQDSSFEAEYIRKFLNCNCGDKTLTQSEFTPINPAVNSIVLQGVGGTFIPAPITTGNTKTYQIVSSVYQIAKADPSDLAFTITVDNTVANTVKYLIKINYDVFAGSILTAISNDPALQNQLSSLVSAIGFNPQGLNGRCIIDLTKANYSLSATVNSATLVTQIVINGTVYNAPANLFANNPSSVQSWLNTLTLGTFSASVSSSTLSIISVGNSNTISTMTFTSPTMTIQFQAHYATENQIFQALFDYICQMTALQVGLGNALAVCSFDYSGNSVTTTISGGDTQGSFNAAVSSAICTIVSRIANLTGLTCSKLQAIFSDNTNASFNNVTDRYLSIVGGNCISLTGYQQALGFIAAVNAYPAVKAAFCAIDCTAPGTCPDITAINMAIVSGNIGIYGVSLTQTPLANQIVTVQYRIHGTLSWNTSTNNLSISPNGNISGSSPYLITASLSTGTTYDVYIFNNCGGAGFIGQITTPTGTVYSGTFRLDNVLANICGDSGITLYSSAPFASGVVMYTNSSLSTLVTGFSYIAPSTGEIFNINSSTGLVGADTGSNCLNGTAGTYILGNSTGTICSGSSVTLYTNGSFTVGGTLYNDPSLTSVVTGNAFVVQASTNTIYNLNATTGVIGSSTGLSCSATNVTVNNGGFAGMQISNVTGITGFTPSPSFPLSPGQTSVGTHSAFTGSIQIVMSGTPVFSGNVALQVNGVLVQCINVTTSGTFTFSSRSYLSTDTIHVSANGGTC